MSSNLNNNQYLSRKNRKLLLDFSIATGNTTDELLYQQYNNTTVEYTRGYLSAFANNAPEQKVLLAYFILKMLVKK